MQWLLGVSRLVLKLWNETRLLFIPDVSVGSNPVLVIHIVKEVADHRVSLLSARVLHIHWSENLLCLSVCLLIWDLICR